MSRRPRLESLEDRTLLSFGGYVSYDLPNNATGIVAADFRGNGITDLATSSGGSNSAGVLLGNGNGTFPASATHYAAGSYPLGIAVGAFDGTGRKDFAVSNQGSNSITVFLNNGDGTFFQEASYFCGSAPLQILAADLNKDGKTDLITANNNDGTVSVLLGNGDGTFQAAKSYFSNSPAGLTVGDYYGDGNLSIAVTNGYNGTIGILRGNGDGTFQSPVTIPFDGRAVGITSADLNHDGHTDLVVTNYSSNKVEVLLNKGDGSFATALEFGTDSSPSAIAVADFNGDGGIDLAVSCMDSNSVDVFLGHGDGTFASRLAYNTGSGPNGIVAADLNGDGRPDLATSNVFNGGGASVLLNDGVWPSVGKFALTAATQTVAGQPLAVTVTARDLQGNLVSGYTGTVQFSSSDPNAGLPPAYTFTTADQGTHTFNIPFTTAGMQSLSVADTQSYFTGGLSNLSVLPAQTSHFSFAGIPSSLTAGSLQVFAAQATDVYGNVTPGYTGTVAFASSDPAASLPGNYTFTTSDQGSHNFSVVLRTAGTQSVKMTDTTSGVSVSQGGIVVQAAAASSFAVTGFPATTAGSSGTFTLSAHDAYGNLATGYSGTVHFTSTDGQALLPGDYTFTGTDQGTHVFGAVLYTAGSQTLTATDTGNSALAGNQTGILVSAGTLSSLRVFGFPASSVAGVLQTFTVVAADAYGNAVAGYTGTVHFTSSDTKASLPANYTFTAADHGRHTFGAILVTAGTRTLTAKDTHTASLTGSQTGIDVVPAAASVMRIIGLPSSTHVGQIITFTMTLYDAYGNVATGYLGKVHFTSTDGSATLPPAYTFTAQDAGTHIFAIIFRKKGKQGLTGADTLDTHLKTTTSIQVLA